MRLHGPRPTASRSHVRDIATVATLFAFSAGGSLVSVLAPGSPDAVWPSVLLSAIASTALFWRRTHPRAVAAVTALCILGEGSLGYLLTPLLQGPLMVALYSLGLRTCRSTTRTGALATAVLLVVTGLFAEPVGHYGLLLTTVNPVAWVLLPAVLGSSVRLRRDYLAAVHARAEHAERTREEEARHRVAQERMRIARELHDVVAHHLALANAQAGTAAHLARTHPERAQDMLDSLAGTTASALRELKATVGLLRQDSDPDAALGPAPGLAQVDDLITAFTGAGLAVTVTTEGEPRPLAPGADLTAFRIVQEALTNVTKHAGTGAAWVRLDYSADRLSLTVTDEGTATRTPPAPGHGFGLIGMRERAQSAGGVLRAGPRPEGGFEVSCSLPLLPPLGRKEPIHVTTRVLLVDDQALLRATFRILIDSTPGMTVVAEAADGSEAVDLARTHHPDVVLMDIRMPGTDGLAATTVICGDPGLSTTRVLILTTFENDEYVARALRAGASGFLGKDVSAEVLLDGIRTVAAGESLLSPTATRALIARFLATPEPDALLVPPERVNALTAREREVMALAAHGRSNTEIAEELVVSPLTVRSHVQRAMAKLHAHDRAQLVVIAYQSGLVRTRPPS